jgi:hypothetical protein
VTSGPAALFSPALAQRDETGIAVVVVAVDGAVLEVLYVDGDYMSLRRPSARGGQQA